MKRDQSVPFVSLLRHPGIFADKCNAGHDRWKAALSRALVIFQAGGKICTPGKICHQLCVVLG